MEGYKIGKINLRRDAWRRNPQTKKINGLKIWWWFTNLKYHKIIMLNFDNILNIYEVAFSHKHTFVYSKRYQHKS